MIFHKMSDKVMASGQGSLTFQKKREKEKTEMRSDNVKKGMQQAPHRSLFNALGFTKEEMDKPMIGIVSSYNEIVPGHMNLDKIVEAVKLGVAMAGGVPVRLALEEKDEFKLTKEKLLSAITDKTKMVVLPFPNNPTGAIMTHEELQIVADVIKEHDLFVLSDEIYSELSYQGDHVSIAAIPGMKERSVVINGFSKSYAMTGWRLGYAVGPKEIIKQMIKVHQYLIMSAPTTSQYAAIEALRNGDEDVAKMRESYDERRRFLVKELREIGMPCFEPMGAFYVFPNISRFGMTSEEFAKTLLEKEHVAVVPGSAFGTCGEGFLRISYAYSIEDLKKALVKIQNFIDTIS